MLPDAAHTWFGGIFCPTGYTPRGLYRPEVGAWISAAGDLLGMLAEPPGRGARALEQALQVALRRHCLPRPARLAVADARLGERLRLHTELPIELRGHARFDSIVGATLERIAGREAPSPHVERAVSHALARALLLGTAAASCSSPPCHALEARYAGACPGGRATPAHRKITPERWYLRRRELMKNIGLGAATAAGVGGGLLALVGNHNRPRSEPKATSVPSVALQTRAPTHAIAPIADPPTPLRDVTTYNNFYEFGLDKSDPSEHSGTLRPRPWTIQVDGELARPRTLDIDNLLRDYPQEERIYRMRCVEAWSMVIPWVGFPLADLIARLEPTSRAKYVAFTTLLDPTQMPGQEGSVLDWPYREGLRIDEATHPLTLLAVGLYGKTLPNQNGAPLRLVVPWKYGFKGIKSIVGIRFTDKQPATTWNSAAPGEYGFYANVNPEVDHPRWSQATERRIGELERRRTLAFNGYGEEVASLYRGLDLRRNF